MANARGHGESLEFVLLCFLQTAAQWMQGTIPDSATVSLPSNVGHLAAALSMECENAFEFNTKFVACLARLPNGGVVVPDLAGVRGVIDSEPWAAQDKIRVRVQIVLRAYFGFLARMIVTSPKWTNIALRWLECMYEPSHVVAGMTSACVLQFFESLETVLR